MPSGAWGDIGQGLQSKAPGPALLQSFFGRRIAKRGRRYEKARMKAVLNEAERDVGEFEQNAPIQEQHLQQSLASRGLGTSSISEQDTRNLLSTQARQRASVHERYELARQGYSLWRKQAKYQKRMGPLKFLEGLMILGGRVVSAAASGGMSELGQLGQEPT